MDIEILSEAALRAWCRRIDLPSGAHDELVRVSERITTDSELLSLFSAFHEQVAVRGEWHTTWSPLPFDPLVTEKLGAQDSLFYFLAYLSALPHAESEYRRFGFGEDVFVDTMRDLSVYFNQASDLHGYWRFDNFQWIWRHLACRLFRLGRLQYMLETYHGHATAFRNKQTGEVLLLCGKDFALRADGYALGAGFQPELSPSIKAEEVPWYAVYEQSEAGWRGNPVNPHGFAFREPVFLEKADWECILTLGDTVIDLHIPRGKDMTTEDLRHSLRRAFDFFPCHPQVPDWPAQPFKACFCHTWFFTPQLQTLLPPSSSIVKFQREFYLYPYPGGPGFLWAFVFGEKYRDPASAPRDTSLRRSVLDWLSAGKELFDLAGVMFHSPEEWGAQPYQSKWEKE